MGESKKIIRANYISNRLAELYPGTPKPPLDHSNTYTLLVAVLLSAQCRDDRVNQVTPELFKKADSAKKMLKLSVEEIQNIIRPCGLSLKKAQSISGLSKIIMEKYDGVVPNQLEDLETLPGVGHKTAQVVMIQAFNQPAFPVDTHIHRLAKRWKLSDGSSVLKTEKDLKNLYPMEQWADLHLRIIFYGRQHCAARGCDGKTCLICHEIIKLKL